MFSADPLSSVAYATEQAMIVLFAVSISGRDAILPLSAVVAGLLAVVVLSYRQTVRAYTTSGGAYAVAKDNLGTIAGLIAAAALLIDYVLTVAVSISAGVTAITSAYRTLTSFAVPMAVAFVILLTLVNLRGVRETGLAFAAPTYGFVAAVVVTLLVGLAECASSCPHATVPSPKSVGPAGATIGIFVLLHAFASGSTALTGIEAISNGVGAFRSPKGVNAARTLGWMGAIAIVLFLGVSVMAVQVRAAPSRSVSVLSQIARAVFPTTTVFSGVLFYIVQLLTFAVLILAANSAFQGFPRLASLLARDRFLPREFGDMGDRLVYSNGALVLAVLATVLVIGFGGNVERLIQLYVVGVFSAFTLSQVGMVRYWLRTHGRDVPDASDETVHWRRALALNAAGACATGLVTAVVLATKFLHGAWIVVLAMPLIVVWLRHVHSRYRHTERELRSGAIQLLDQRIHNTVVLYIRHLDAACHEAMAYARYLEEDSIHAAHLGGHHQVRDIRSEWRRLGGTLELKVLEIDERDPVDAVVEYVGTLERPDGAHFVTVVTPELMRKASLIKPLRHHPVTDLKLRLLTEPGVVVADVPVLDEPGAPPLAPEQIDPHASAAFVLISAVDDAALNALNYARALHSFPTYALHFALHPEEAETIEAEWGQRQLPMELEVVDCPYRELGDPLLERLRSVTRNKNGIAAVILPEPVVGGPVRSLLQNRRALYLRWLLLFEPQVVLTSVPYRVGDPAAMDHHARGAE